VAYVDSAFDDGSSLAFPTQPGLFAIGLFGPNFTFASSAIPEPSTWAMMVLGFAGLGYAGFRRALRTA
jgi:PEP-CTERM motif